MGTTTRTTDQRIADLNFADDIVLLEINLLQAQLDTIKVNAS